LELRAWRGPFPFRGGDSSLAGTIASLRKGESYHRVHFTYPVNDGPSLRSTHSNTPGSHGSPEETLNERTVWNESTSPGNESTNSDVHGHSEETGRSGGRWLIFARARTSHLRDAASLPRECSYFE